MVEEWRVIELSSHTGPMNMAIDESISHFVKLKQSKPTIRFYTWNPSCVTIGYHQSLNDEVDVLKCKDLGIDIVRRLTGGGAVYHDKAGEITYSVIAPENVFDQDIIKSYKQICQLIIDGFEEMGLNAQFKPINDILVNGKKISGNAQTRRGGILCQHGTILYQLNIPIMFSVLKISNEKISDKMIKSVEERVTSIKNENAMSLNESYRALLEAFIKNKQIEFGKLTKQEIEFAEKLVVEKYQTKEWNFKR